MQILTTITFINKHSDKHSKALLVANTLYLSVVVEGAITIPQAAQPITNPMIISDREAHAS
jgi:hypothetical protein